jgi:hypothetical protein
MHKSYCGDLYPRTCQKEEEIHLTDEPRHLTTRKGNVARRRYKGTPVETPSKGIKDVAPLNSLY